MGAEKKEKLLFSFHQRMAAHSMAAVIEWPPEGIEIRLGEGEEVVRVCVCKV